MKNQIEKSNQANNFWQDLAKEDAVFVGLSPMDGVTDQPFRQIVAKYGKPGVIFTEFTHVAGLCHGASVMLRQLLYEPVQRPIVAQIYGKEPKYFRQVALLVAALGFDGVDINMGCPSKSVAGGGAGAGLIETPKLAQDIIRAVQAGVDDWVQGKTPSDCPDLSKKILDFTARFSQQLPIEDQARLDQHQPIPVSVKTRIGTSHNEVETWIPQILELEPAALSLHGRTLRQGYSGQADWQAIALAGELAREAKVVMLGNGDVADYSQAQIVGKQYQVDGVLIGRAAQGNPHIFRSDEILDGEPQLLEIALEHAKYYQHYFEDKAPKLLSVLEDRFSFLPMRKHLAWYAKGFAGASQLRSQLVRTNDYQQVESILKPVIDRLDSGDVENSSNRG